MTVLSTEAQKNQFAIRFVSTPNSLCSAQGKAPPERRQDVVAGARLGPIVKYAEHN